MLRSRAKSPNRTRPAPARSSFLRARDGGPQETTTVELFFDLVYVFAITQLSHLVIDSGISLPSVGHAAFLLVVVWWAWIYSTWMVNWFDPRTPPVRLIVAAVGLTSLLMSAAIPHAFGSDAVAVRLCLRLHAGRPQHRRDVAAGARSEPLRLVFERLVAWSVLSAPLWIAGAFVGGPARLALWGPALALDLIAPMAGYATPFLGRSLTSDWKVEGSHFADRFQAFVIIALGESIVVTGATASADGLTTKVVLALAVAFLVTGALWWLYFGEIAESSQRRIAESDDPGRLARDAYTYLHAADRHRDHHGRGRRRPVDRRPQTCADRRRRVDDGRRARRVPGRRRARAAADGRSLQRQTTARDARARSARARRLRAARRWPCRSASPRSWSRWPSPSTRRRWSSATYRHTSMSTRPIRL